MGSKPGFRTIGWRGQCPHCGGDVTFRLKTDFGAFDHSAPDAEWLASLSGVERELLELAQSTGVFDSFDRTCRETRGMPPKNLPKAFLNFLGRMRPQPLTDVAALALQSEFPKSQPCAYSCGDISVIVVNGEMRMFVPTVDLFQKKVAAVPSSPSASGSGTLKVRELGREMSALRDWVKTRMGYVPAEGAMFLREMRKRCYGAFGTHEKTKNAGSAQ